MDLMLWITLIVALLLSLAALAYVVLPLLSKQPPLLQVEDDRLTDLLARKDTALRAIKELEFDHQVGKIGGEDYARFRERLNRQAIGLIQQLEKITPESVVLDQELEQAIAQQRRAQTPVLSSSNGATAPTPAVAGKRFCTQCGAQIGERHKFCGNCGAPIEAPTDQEQ